jgi:recombination protein RecA
MASDKTPNEAKMKALEAALDQITKAHGDEAVMDMGADPRPIDSISTGALPLDIALGIGGIPKGRIVEIFGPESSGKTTLCYHIMAQVQKEGGVAAFIDTENAMDAAYAQNLGVDIEKLIVSQPDYGEQALEIAEVLTQSAAVDLIVIDSVAALVPRAELEGAMGDSSVGVQARLMSKACRKLAPQANKNGTTIVFTNQIREKIGVMFGSPETQPGGRALKFYSSVRLDIRRIEQVKEGTEVVANRTRVKVVKNKVAPPFKQAEFEIIFGEGIDNLAALRDLGQDPDVDLVGKSGAFYTFKATGEKAQGGAKARVYLQEHPEVAAELDEKIRQVFLGTGPDPVEEVVEESSEEVSEEEADETVA